MAIINPTVNRTPQGANSVFTAQWALGNADTGVAVTMTDFSDKSIQIEGTFGGATVTIQGSNDGVNWETLRDPGSVALTFTSAGLKQVLEMTYYLRAITAGGSGTAVTVTLCGRALSPKSWS
ncbi:MAG: hypothetical protein JO269_09610 [Burkholderiaceae bacterium]|nr:hypothetical protein [Burkholderiaceae bacterium]